MKVAGIVAEYNPFHKGHAYQIQKIKKMFGEDTGIVCVMSGDFVQRGEPAIFAKHARAEAAVRCGADLVIELPVSYSVASSERFAEGAIHILGKLGNVDYLVFGSESGDGGGICQTADVVLSDAFHVKVKEILESGCSYPAARTMAVEQLCGQGSVTKTPNDNLGVEYVKAIMKHGYLMQPVAVKRVGAKHDQEYSGALKSGSEIRSRIFKGKNFYDNVPEAAFEVYLRETSQGRGPIAISVLEQAILSRLRMLPVSDFANLPDATEGIDRRLYAMCKTKTCLDDIYNGVKSKRYTHARIRRMTLGAALGIHKDDYSEDHLYARVLALNERGGTILKNGESNRTIPVISKPSNARLLDKNKQALFMKTASAHDLYVLGYQNPEMRAGERDWVTSPVFMIH